MILKLIQKLPVWAQKSLGVAITLVTGVLILSGWLSLLWAGITFVINGILVVAWWHYVIGAMYPSRRTRGADGKFIASK